MHRGGALAGSGRVALTAGAIAAAALAIGQVGSRSTAEAGRAPARPSIVVIQADDQSLEMMRVMERTNRLLGERGATFRNHFANWPACCPSRATQLTGQYAHNHGVLSAAGYDRFDREDNLAVWLGAAGYEVAHVGKFLNGYGPPTDDPATIPNERNEVPPGWTDWRSGAAGTTHTFYNYIQSEWSGEPDEVPRDGIEIPYGGAEEDYKGDVNTDDAVDLISDYGGPGNPFYLQVDYLAPHAGGPAQTPQPPNNCLGGPQPTPRHAHVFDDEPLAALQDPSFNEADVADKPPHVADNELIASPGIENITRLYRCRLESTLAIDEGVAEIVRALRAAGELESTYIFYMADNGFFHGEHRIRPRKNEVYEPSIRLPFLLRGPGVPEGVKVNELTINADFATTVLEVTGAEPIVRAPDGRSLLPIVRSPREEAGRELLIETLQFTAIRTQRYKWVEYEADNFVELYDLKRDPYEEENVAGESRYADVAAALASRLDALRDCSGAGCRLRPELAVTYAAKPKKRSCVERRLRVKLTGADEGEVTEARFFSRGDLVGVDRDPPIKHRIGRRKLQGNRPAQARTEATLLDGRRVVWARQFKICR
jgi:N-acetylglucosamine-6-sulfatase